MKNKGFTLIELLAVILILGIIALIAVPTVNSVLEDARRGAFVNTNRNIVKVIGDKCMMDLIKGNETNSQYTIEDGKFLQENIDIKGELPTKGNILVDNECNVKIAASSSKYCVIKDENNDFKLTDYDEDTCSLDYSSYLNETVEDTCFIYDVIHDSTLNEDVVSIKAYNYLEPRCDTTTITIPTTIDNKKVTRIQEEKNWGVCDNTYIINENTTSIIFENAIYLSDVEANAFAQSEFYEGGYCGSNNEYMHIGEKINEFDFTHNKKITKATNFEFPELDKIKYPSSITEIERDTFNYSFRDENIILYFDMLESEMPEGWEENYYSTSDDATVEFKSE